MRFVKGQGTGNDFVILPDPDGALDLTPELVRALCHRRFGLGADGVLRVVRAAKHRDGVRYAADAEWFMDYHNADGSLAEMCGNGVRVYTRFLESEGWAGDGPLTLATRTGLVTVTIAGAEISATMPVPVLAGDSVARVGGRDYPGTAGSVGNPHLVCPVPDATALSTVDFFAPLVVDAAVFPESANVEFVAPGSDPLDVLMRVYERGSGETLSCGSGACVVAAVMLRDAGLAAGTVTVHVPGGVLRVTLAPQSCALAGPAVLVAEGSFFDLTRLI